MPYQETVQLLVRSHLEDEYPPSVIYVFLDPEEKEIRLLEVTSLEPETGEVYPFTFGPTPDVPYRTVIAQVTPKEFEEISRGKLELPEGWCLRDAQEIKA